MCHTHTHNIISFFKSNRYFIKNKNKVRIKIISISHFFLFTPLEIHIKLKYSLDDDVFSGEHIDKHNNIDIGSLNI